MVESLFAVLNYCQHIVKLLACHVKRSHDIVEGEHVVEMLILNHSRNPSGSETSWVQNDKITLWNCVVGDGCHYVAQVIFLLVGHFQRNFTNNKLFQIGTHLWHPLLLVDGLDFWMSVNLLIMEPPVDQWSCVLDLSFR